MENRRFFLLAILGVIGFLLYQSWQKDYRSTSNPAADASSQQVVPPTDDAPRSAVATESPAVANAATSSVEVVRVETDRYLAEIGLVGGELRRVELRGYAYSKKDPAKNLALMNDRDGRLLVLQSGLAGSQEPLATHKTRYASAQPTYRLADGATDLDVPLEYQDPSGFVVRKTFHFERESYEIGLTQTLVNHTAAQLAAGPYARFLSNAKIAGEEPPFTKSFLGLGVYEQKEGTQNYRFRKISFTDLDKQAVEIKQQGGWLALLQHYFVAAIFPPSGESLNFSAKPSVTQGYLAQYVGPLTEVPSQGEKSFPLRLYVGPNLQDAVGKVAPGFELTQDYGMLTPIAEPLFVALNWLHKLTHNWGVAIILLTLVVRALMYKLSEAQYRSMAKMKKFSPRIQEIKERYGDGREKLNKAMMDLYKKEGFNPLAGCWPMLVQFPVFISLYWVLSQSVELRQADFALWINDLSAADPYYVLPVLFGISMFVTQKLSGQQMTDPTQQKIMNLMPVFLSAFFAFSPAGLVLYWLVSSIISIAQQWYITRKFQRQGAA